MACSTDVLALVLVSLKIRKAGISRDKKTGVRSLAVETYQLLQLENPGTSHLPSLFAFSNSQCWFFFTYHFVWHLELVVFFPVKGLFLSAPPVWAAGSAHMHHAWTPTLLHVCGVKGSPPLAACPAQKIAVCAWNWFKPIRFCMCLCQQMRPCPWSNPGLSDGNDVR